MAILPLLASCVSAPPIDYANGDFGLSPYGEHTRIANFTRGWINSKLKDPYSAHVSLSYDQASVINEGVRIYGYSISADVNAKNSFGGYTGTKSIGPYFAHEYSDGRLLFCERSSCVVSR